MRSGDLKNEVRDLTNEVGDLTNEVRRPQKRGREAEKALCDRKNAAWHRTTSLDRRIARGGLLLRVLRAHLVSHMTLRLDEERFELLHRGAECGGASPWAAAHRGDQYGHHDSAEKGEGEEDENAEEDGHEAASFSPGDRSREQEEVQLAREPQREIGRASCRERV